MALAMKFWVEMLFDTHFFVKVRLHACNIYLLLAHFILDRDKFVEPILQPYKLPWFVPLNHNNEVTQSRFLSRLREIIIFFFGSFPSWIVVVVDCPICCTR